MTAAMENRPQVAAAVRRQKTAVSEHVTEVFLANHPAMLARLGERARELGREDAGYHLDFLASTVEYADPSAFADYASWVVSVLTPRGIPAEMVSENLLQIRQALGSRLSEQAMAVLEPFFDAALARTSGPSRPPQAQPASPLAETRTVFVQALLNGDRRAAATVAREALRQGCDRLTLYADVIQEALYEVGCRWEGNQITVAQEHAATAACQYVVAELYAGMPSPPVSRGRAVITGVEGEFHQLGANMVADALELDGWHVQFLGVNTPRAGVLRAIKDHAADVLGVSVTLLLNAGQARALIHDARELVPGIFVIVGGAAFRSVPDLWRHIGANAYAPDVRAAVSRLQGQTG